MTVSRFSTGLREHARETIEKIGQADIVVGVPCYQSAASLAHVILTIAKGIETHYPDAKALIMISDGGSTDDSREVARQNGGHFLQYRKARHDIPRHPRKRIGLRAVFEAAVNFLKSRRWPYSIRT